MPQCSKTIRETGEERPERTEGNEKRQRGRQQEERYGKANYDGSDGDMDIITKEKEGRLVEGRTSQEIIISRHGLCQLWGNRTD